MGRVHHHAMQEALSEVEQCVLGVIRARGWVRDGQLGGAHRRPTIQPMDHMSECRVRHITRDMRAQCGQGLAGRDPIRNGGHRHRLIADGTHGRDRGCMRMTHMLARSRAGVHGSTRDDGQHGHDHQHPCMHTQGAVPPHAFKSSHFRTRASAGSFAPRCWRSRTTHVCYAPLITFATYEDPYR